MGTIEITPLFHIMAQGPYNGPCMSQNNVRMILFTDYCDMNLFVAGEPECFHSVLCRFDSGS